MPSETPSPSDDSDTPAESGRDVDLDPDRTAPNANPQPLPGKAGDLRAADDGRAFLTALSTANGTATPEVDDAVAQRVGEMFGNAATSSPAQRADGSYFDRNARPFGGPNEQYGGERDIWSLMGYPDPMPIRLASASQSRAS